MSTCSPAPQPSRRPIYLMTKSPPQLRGRVVGVMTSLAYAAGPLGFMLGGPLTDATGLRMTFLVLAIPMIAIGLASLRLSSLRELDESSGPGPGPT